MRRFARYLVLSAFSLCTACSSSSHYKISLRDGREFLTETRPYFVEKTGYYRYKDLSGKDALVRSDEVITINEL